MLVESDGKFNDVDVLNGVREFHLLNGGPGLNQTLFVTNILCHCQSLHTISEGN